ncbi:MAG TPA: bifunctional phosphopantothenoylcysteine decarboxylase/phosphopantothenate--cysteine ligase CoaBC [Actinomycetota bacterium]|nr:bifunctional phosphopantothenoylcysteine decarboxylase/phosphopantothenate--cysteine ligase CoaBC [Actinomycetota bacterium]
MSDLRGRRVLLGVTGGIAAYKAAYLARELTRAGATVTAVLTESATRFIGTDTFAGLTGRRAYDSIWEAPGEVLHVRLARSTDVAVIAPATANTIAKLAHGLADDLLSATLLEYDGPLVIAPALHSGMWAAAATQANVATLVARGVAVVGPVEGALAHGDDGIGRMSEPAEIVDAAIAAAEAPGMQTATRAWDSLAAHHVLVTAGPTREPIDPVRYLGNRSSGKMGVAVAAEALARGARVTLVLGPGAVRPPIGVEVIDVDTADEMRAAVLGYADDADVIVMAAAVADFRPKAAAERKLKKEHGVPELLLEPTPDILAEVGARKRAGQVVVGFAAETHDVEAAGRAKLVGKHLDLLVANEVGRDGTGFGGDSNHAAIVAASGDDVALRTWTKAELATALWDRVAALLGPAAPPEP